MNRSVRIIIAIAHVQQRSVCAQEAQGPQVLHAPVKVLKNVSHAALGILRVVTLVLRAQLGNIKVQTLSHQILVQDVKRGNTKVEQVKGAAMIVLQASTRGAQELPAAKYAGQDILLLQAQCPVVESVL